MRRQAREGVSLVKSYAPTQQQLPVTKPVVQYVRQSRRDQVKHNRVSGAMQDNDMRNNLINMGWTPELILEAISEDTGKSGTKRADERKGLARLIKLIEDGKVGAVAAFNCSRIYRVLSKAEFGSFCDLVLSRVIPVVTARRVYWPTEADNKSLASDFQAAADYVEDHIKGVVIAARDYHIENDISWGGNSHPFGFVIATSETRKHYTEYLPHSELVRKLLARFRQISGNLPLFARELAQTDFRFPAFEPGVLHNIRMKPDEDGTYPLRTRSAIVSLLTNRALIGFYGFGGSLVSRTAHEPIVPLEDFVYAYWILTGRNIDDEPEERPARERRYSEPTALLNGIVRCDGAPVYIADGRYCARPDENGFYRTPLVVQVEALDDAFSGAMVGALAAIGVLHQRGVSDTLHARVQELQQEQEHQATDFTKALARIDKETVIATMDKRVSLEAGDENGARMAASQLAQLGRDRRAIQAKQIHATREATDLSECGDLIECAVQKWGSMTRDQQKRLVKLLVTSANLSEASMHFIRLDVVLTEPINFTMTIHLYRACGSWQKWTAEEDETLREMFPDASQEEIMQALPYRSWPSICHRGWATLGIRRTSHQEDTLTYTDMQLVKETGACVDRPVCSVTSESVLFSARSHLRSPVRSGTLPGASMSIRLPLQPRSPSIVEQWSVTVEAG